MSTKPYDGPTITHQACETVPYRTGQPITRCWSKWTNGEITHNDTVVDYVTMRDGYTVGLFKHVNLGRDPDMRPPPGLKWIDTVAMRRQIDAEKPQG